MTLVEFLGWLLGSGGIGWLCSALLSWLDDHWFDFASLRADLKRLASFGITAIVAGLVGYGAIVVGAWMGYAGAPAAPQEWVERIFAIIAAAIIAGQVRHGEAVLRVSGGE